MITLGRQVLVIEEDHDARVALRNTLEAEGYAVTSVTTIKDASRVIGETKVFHAILIADQLAASGAVRSLGLSPMIKLTKPLNLSHVLTELQKILTR